MSKKYIELKRENLIFEGKTEKEKKTNETIYDLCLENDALYEENKELNNILTEYEKWLEEEIEKRKGANNPLDPFQVDSYYIKLAAKTCLDKLKELKEGKNGNNEYW